MTQQLREWQQRALERCTANFHAGKTDFMAVACPGAGKTTWALSVAWEMVKANQIDLVIVVVPSDELRRQWANNTSTPLELREFVLRDAIVHKSGYHGVVTTYQALGGVTAGRLRVETGPRTLVILDEIHHAADSAAYGDNLRYAFDNAGYRLLLTGTPWRTNQRERIPFVTYNEITRELEYDYQYGYGEAVRDGVCRPIHFPVVDGKVAWRPEPGADITEITMTADLDVKPEDQSPALRALLEEGWLTDVLQRAHDDLLSYRKETPDAGGLIVAKSQEHAYRIQSEMWKITGRRPAVVVSDAEDARAEIDRFRRSSDEWIIAVRMIAEGVDIPRLVVGVYATNYQTKMFFTQVVGRFVRVRDGERVTATMYVPPVSTLIDYATEIEGVSRYALDESERERQDRPAADGTGRLFSPVEVLGSEAIGLAQVVAAGESIDGDLVAQWQNKLRGTTIPAHYAAQLAALDGTTVTVEPEPAPAPRKSRAEREKELRDSIRGLVGQVAHRCLGDHTAGQEVNNRLVKQFGPRGKASVETLERTERYLQVWLKRGAQPWAS